MFPFIFSTRVSGIPCKIKVNYYKPEQPLRHFGPNLEDVLPPEPSEIVYEILDRKGYPAAWLARKITDSEDARIQDEFLGNYYEDLYGLSYA